MRKQNFISSERRLFSRSYAKFYLVIFIALQSFASPAQEAGINNLLITDFHQGKVTTTDEFGKCIEDNVPGNCVAIALIKAALAEFKTVANIYKSYTVQNGIISIEFADGFKVTINQEEIDIVKNLAGIQHAANSVYYDSAVIIYASICKRVLLDNNIFIKKRSCIKNFANAVEYINWGYPTVNAYGLLGLKQQFLDIRKLSAEPNAIIWCTAHAAYCTYGNQDLLGQPIVLHNKRMRNLKRFDRKNKAYKLIK